VAHHRSAPPDRARWLRPHDSDLSRESNLKTSKGTIMMFTAEAAPGPGPISSRSLRSGWTQKPQLFGLHSSIAPLARGQASFLWRYYRPGGRRHRTHDVVPLAGTRRGACPSHWAGPGHYHGGCEMGFKCIVKLSSGPSIKRSSAYVSRCDLHRLQQSMFHFTLPTIFYFT
jgi:hypothetical protein